MAELCKDLPRREVRKNVDLSNQAFYGTDVERTHTPPVQLYRRRYVQEITPTVPYLGL